LWIYTHSSDVCRWLKERLPNLKEHPLQSSGSTSISTISYEALKTYFRKRKWVGGSRPDGNLEWLARCGTASIFATAEKKSDDLKTYSCFGVDLAKRKALDDWLNRDGRPPKGFWIDVRHPFPNLASPNDMYYAICVVLNDLPLAFALLAPDKELRGTLRMALCLDAKT
jgi:hypothetical protein